MTDPVVLDEFHLTLRVPAGLPDPKAPAARRALGSAAFRRRLEAAIREVLARHRALAAVTAEVSR